MRRGGIINNLVKNCVNDGFGMSRHPHVINFDDNGHHFHHHLWFGI